MNSQYSANDLFITSSGISNLLYSATKKGKNIMAKLEVNTYENTGATKDTAPYLGTFVSKGSIDFATLAKQVSKLSGLPPIQAETILRGGIDELTKLERDGAVRINFDGGCIHLVIKGTFDSSDAAFDPEKNSLELVWQLSDDIRNSLANETPKIVTDGRECGGLSRKRHRNKVPLRCGRGRLEAGVHGPPVGGGRTWRLQACGQIPRRRCRRPALDDLPQGEIPSHRRGASHKFGEQRWHGERALLA